MFENYFTLRFFFPLILFVIINTLNAQNQYPKNYFLPPVKIPVVLAGTFGELRSNHFHSGVDIKTQGKEGIPVYAPADGYVSRIKVQQYGFGKALYINHPNGYTTVYAHLEKFEPYIQQYVKNVQYKKENYDTGNLFPKPEKFPVKKGQLIGYTGDTGSSQAPHLHYEIRDTKTERIINPMHFGLSVKDDKAPTIQKLIAYPLSDDARINNSSLGSTLSFKKNENGTFITEKITACGTIGFGICVFDRLNGAINRNGIYSLEMKVNGKRVYYHDVETFSFAESKYINLLIDYEHYKKYKNKLQRTYKIDANKLSMYKDLVNNGKIHIEENSNYNIEIIAKDFDNNTSEIRIPVQGTKSNLVFKQKDTTDYKINAADFNKFHQKNVTVAFPKNTFYQDCFIDFIVENGTAKVHNPTIPLDKRYTLTFETSFLSEDQKQHVYIANVTNPKYPRYTTTKKDVNKVYTTTKLLGDYALRFDTEAPSVQFYNFNDKQWISKNNTLKVKIRDEKTGIKNYHATIDGEWILMEYNHKKGILTYDFSDKKLVGSKHLFKIVVSDNVGNTKTVSATFFKK